MGRIPKLTSDSLALAYRKAKALIGLTTEEVRARARVGSTLVIPLGTGELPTQLSKLSSDSRWNKLRGLVRVARVLQADPKQWLHLAGYPCSDEELSQMIREGEFKSSASDDVLQSVQTDRLVSVADIEFLLGVTRGLAGPMKLSTVVDLLLSQPKNRSD